MKYAWENEEPIAQKLKEMEAKIKELEQLVAQLQSFQRMIEGSPAVNKRSC